MLPTVAVIAYPRDVDRGMPEDRLGEPLVRQVVGPQPSRVVAVASQNVGVVGVHVVTVDYLERIELVVVQALAMELLPVRTFGRPPDPPKLAFPSIHAPCAPQPPFAVEAVSAQRHPALHEQLSGALLQVELVVVPGREETLNAPGEGARFGLAGGRHAQDHLVGRLGQYIRQTETTADVEVLKRLLLYIQETRSVPVGISFASLHFVAHGLPGGKEEQPIVQPSADADQLHRRRVQPEGFLGEIGSVVDLDDGVAIPSGDPHQGQARSVGRDADVADYLSHRPLLQGVGGWGSGCERRPRHQHPQRNTGPCHVAHALLLTHTPHSCSAPHQSP